MDILQPLHTSDSVSCFPSSLHIMFQIFVFQTDRAHLVMLNHPVSSTKGCQSEVRNSSRYEFRYHSTLKQRNLLRMNALFPLGWNTNKIPIMTPIMISSPATVSWEQKVYEEKMKILFFFICSNIEHQQSWALCYMIC